MASENAKIDNNYKKTLTAITDDVAAEIRRLLVDPTTGRLKVSAVVTAGAIASLNGLDDAIQTFAVGTTGDDFNIVSAAGTHTFHIPDASATKRGLLTSADWTTFNDKAPLADPTFTGTVTVPDPTNPTDAVNLQTLESAIPSSLQWYLANAASADIAGYKLLATVNDAAQTSVTADGTADGQALDEWVTLVNTPGAVTISEGQIDTHFYAKVGGVANTDFLYQIKARVYKRTGAAETQLGADTSSLPVLSTSSALYSVHTHLTEPLTLVAGDRIVIKLLTVRTGTAPRTNAQIVTVYMGATTPSHASIPTTLAILGNYLPLAGGTMTGDILGAVSIAATGTRIVKGWFTNLEITNLPTVNGGTLVSALPTSSTSVTGVLTGTDWTTFNNKLSDLVPTDLKISTASKGGVFNGGFELGTKDTAVTASGVIGVNSGWYLSEDAGQMSAELDTAVAYKDTASLKLEAIDTSGGGVVYNTSGVTLPILSLGAIPLKVSTVYKLTLQAKTNLVGASGVWADLIQYDSAAVVGTTVSTSKLSTTNDWTVLTVTFTSDNDAVFGRIALQNSVVGTVSQAWFDDVTLEEIVTDTTFTGKVAEKIRPVLQATTSTDNIDNSLDPAGAYANTYALTNAVSEGATHIQTFTPTKKYTTQIGVWVVEAGTAVDWTLVVHTAGNVRIASKQILAASLVEGAFNYFDVPNIWTSGALHFHLYASATTGTPTVKANTSDDLETASYIQRYAKKTEGFTVICNGIKTELKANSSDGLLSNSIIDLDNGKYRYAASFATVSDATIYVNDVFEASAGGITTAPSAVNGWAIGSALLQTLTGATERYATWKVNTILPVRHCKIKMRTYYTNNAVQISSDNINWTTLSITASDLADISVRETDLINGLSTFYIRLYKEAATNAQLTTDYLYINADLDTSSTPQGIIYPIGTNQFTETVKLPSSATRVYYRKAKLTNEYRVVVPCLECTDASAVSIGYTPLKLDNSQETNPSVDILTGTTNWQQSGTGSNDSTTGYILNDGEYLTLSTAVAELSVIYKVGGGTTTFANITKNTLFLSSNGESSDSTQDPSHQGNFIIGARQQGLTDAVKDIRNHLEDVRNGIVKSSLWTSWIPTLTWTTGTPEGSVVTKARYKIVDGICNFTFYYSATDANGATALTISLPVLPKDNDTLTALQSQELADTTWSNPIAYIDDGGTTIVFRSFSTIADTKAVKVLVTGSYEI